MLTVGKHNCDFISITIWEPGSRNCGDQGVPEMLDGEKEATERVREKKKKRETLDELGSCLDARPEKTHNRPRLHVRGSNPTNAVARSAACLLSLPFPPIPGTPRDPPAPESRPPIASVALPVSSRIFVPCLLPDKGGETAEIRGSTRGSGVLSRPNDPGGMRCHSDRLDCHFPS